MTSRKGSNNKDWVGNYGSVIRTLGSRNLSTEDREANDFYATTPEAAEWLIKLENLSPNIWECACGEGHLSKVFENHGYIVKSTDLIDRGYGEGGVDFLKQTDTFKGDIVTNPPYRYALEFIEHALELIPEGNKVCMFLKIQYLEGKTRRTRLYDRTPPKRVWVSSGRLQCGKNGDFRGSAVAYAWYIWVKGYQGETVVKWFN